MSTAADQVSVYRYKAFISYSRSADEMVAPVLQKRLKQFGKPWYRLRAMSVFRDQTGLPLTTELWHSIEEALARSEFLILLASPRAAQSPWVNQEVDYWVRHRSLDHLIIVWTEGQIVWDAAAEDFDWNASNALPRCLQKAFRAVPNFGDLRWVKSNLDLSLRRPRFLEEIAKLRATLLQKPVEDIFEEDAQEHRKTMRMLRLAVASLAVLTMASVGGFYLSFQAKGTADRLAAQRLAEARAAREREEALRRHQQEVERSARLEQQKQADSRQLAARAEQMLQADRQLGMLLALEAVKIAATDEAERSLRQSLLDLPARTVLQAESDTPVMATFSPEGKWILTSGESGVIQCWDATTASNLWTLNLGKRSAGTWSVRAFSSDGQKVLTVLMPDTLEVGYWDGGAVQLHAGGSGRLLAEIKDKAAVDAALSPDGKLIVTAGFDTGVRLWDSGGNVLKSLHGHEGRVSCESFSSNGNWIVTGSWDNTARVWEAGTGRCLQVLRTTKSIQSAAFNPAGSRILTIGRDKKGCDVLLWDWVNKPGSSIAAFSGHEGAVTGFAFSSDGKWLLTAGRDKTARLWKTATGACLYVLSGHTEDITGIDFSPDGKWLVTASLDHTARLWETATGQQLMELGSNDSARTSVAFNPDGKRIVTGSLSGVVTLYSCALCGGVNELVDLARTRATRSLTTQERQQYLAGRSNTGQ